MHLQLNFRKKEGFCSHQIALPTSSILNRAHLPPPPAPTFHMFSHHKNTLFSASLAASRRRRRSSAKPLVMHGLFWMMRGERGTRWVNGPLFWRLPWENSELNWRRRRRKRPIEYLIFVMHILIHLPYRKVAAQWRWTLARGGAYRGPCNKHDSGGGAVGLVERRVMEGMIRTPRVGGAFFRVPGTEDEAW